MNKLRFSSINEIQLKMVERYLVVDWNHYSTPIIVTYNGYNINGILWTKYRPLRVIVNINLSKNKSIYKLICSKEKIQNAMELIAINLILQNIIYKTFIY